MLYGTQSDTRVSRSHTGPGGLRAKLHWIDAARTIEALRTPPGNRLEGLRGDRAGTLSIRVNEQYRITFRFEQGSAYEVRCEDYH